MRKTLLIALVLVGCRHGASYDQKNVANPCNANPPSQGFACIDANLVATPNPVHQKADKWVHCFMSNGDAIEIASAIFDNTGHEGGHAWAHINRNAVVGQEYKYTIYDRTNGGEKDPEVMIDP